MPAREGRGWPTTRSTVRQTCTTKRHSPLFYNNVNGSGAVLSPVSTRDRIHQRTEQIVQRRQEVDGQFVGSRKQPRQRHANTFVTRVKSEELIDKVQNEIVQLVEDEQCPAQNPPNTSCALSREPFIFARLVATARVHGEPRCHRCFSEPKTGPHETRFFSGRCTICVLVV